MMNLRLHHLQKWCPDSSLVGLGVCVFNLGTLAWPSTVGRFVHLRLQAGYTNLIVWMNTFRASMSESPSPTSR